MIPWMLMESKQPVCESESDNNLHWGDRNE